MDRWGWLVKPLAFHIPGEPVPKGRPRFNSQTKKARTPDETRHAELAVRSYWMAAGSRKFTGAVELRLAFLMPRPGTHFLSDGVSLSAAGKAAPEHKTDVDNLVKLVMDGLNGCAWHDDRQIVAVHACKRWAPRREMAGTYFLAMEATDEARQDLVDQIIGWVTARQPKAMAA